VHVYNTVANEHWTKQPMKQY